MLVIARRLLAVSIAPSGYQRARFHASLVQERFSCPYSCRHSRHCVLMSLVEAAPTQVGKFAHPQKVYMTVPTYSYVWLGAV